MYIAKGLPEMDSLVLFITIISGYTYLGLITTFLLEKLCRQENAQEFPSLYECVSDLKQSEIAN